MQKSKTFIEKNWVDMPPGVDAMPQTIDGEICNFLADGKKVVKMDCALAVIGNNCFYFITLLYEESVPASKKREDLNKEAEALMDAFPSPSSEPERRPLSTPEYALAATSLNATEFDVWIKNLPKVINWGSSNI